jgi:tRNA-splicing ligase RtcB (3'-phosphate/5'-hydroxy nucleic acid ligase)
MITLQDLTRITDTEWEIPQTFRSDMRVPVRIFATHALLEHIAGDKSLEQAVNAATLPGLVGHVVVMPDMHQGYGFPIGAVAATEFPTGVISPGGIGYDINCGVRLLACSIQAEAAAPYMDTLATLLNQYCPSGVGKDGVINLNEPELERLMREGSLWALKNGYALDSDIARTEEGGCMRGANPAKVSERARTRGRSQIGSVGAGNHFVEVDMVETVLDPVTASIFGLQEGCLVVQIHCGSRGLGHQVCSDYVQEFQGIVQRYGIDLPDRELVCAPLDSPHGQAYLGAMRAAANFAFANRQLLAYSARRAFEQTFAGKLKGWQLNQVYDICHNIGKIETHMVNGIPLKVCVHRKGATRAFGPGAPGLPAEYQQTGQPVLVPGSMGTSSWVLAGTEQSMARSWGSSCHGAGRLMSRTRAKHDIRGDDLRREMEERGIQVRAGSMSGFAEEAPSAYKDVDEVVETVVAAGIARKVARLRPLAVVKG